MRHSMKAMPLARAGAALVTLAALTPAVRPLISPGCSFNAAGKCVWVKNLCILRNCELVWNTTFGVYSC